MSCRLLADALQRTKRYQTVPAVTHEEVLDLVSRDTFDMLLVNGNFQPAHQSDFRVVREALQVNSRLAAVVMLDTLARNQVVEAFRSGARGVFCRTDSFPALCKCISCVHEGQVWASASELHFVVEALVEPLSQESRTPARPLSKREEEISRLVAEGLSNRQISQKLGLSEHTIKNYLFRVFEKLGVETRVELALFTLHRGRRHSAQRPETPTLPMRS